ncbi:hypothetical protein PInf_009515 [Phytophthora infestans]|nr:hypothetical protein PInf_009515 [Phytophthora infestans]
MPHHAGVDLILGTDFMIPDGIRLDLYNSSVKLPDEMVIPLIRSSNAPTKTENKCSEDEGEASGTEDSARTEGDPEECSEQVLRDEQPVIDDRAKFGVIRPSIVGELSSHALTGSESTWKNDSEAVPACHKTAHYASEEYGRVDVCPAVAADSAVQRPSVTTANSKLEVLLSRDVEAHSEGLSWTMTTSNHGNEGEARAKCGVDGLSSADVVNSAMGTPKASIIQSAVVDSTSADLYAESDSDVATAYRHDVSYTGDEFAFREVSSAVSVNSAD